MPVNGTPDDLVTVPIVANIKEEIQVIGHVTIKEQMAHMFDLWSLVAQVTEEGLVFVAVPNSELVGEV